MCDLGDLRLILRRGIEELLNKDNEFYKIDMSTIPNVLLLGNGMLKLGNKGKSWDELLKDIKVREGNINVSKIPNAMQPEALCGVDVEEIQRRVASKSSFGCNGV